MMHYARSCFLAGSFFVTFLISGDGFAHSRRHENADGLPIAQIAHGEMIVFDRYRARIIQLASQALDTNERFRRLMNYANIQRAYCAWGIVPGSLTDEDSPFNECSHAFLAATKAVLIDMRSMPNEKQKADELVSEIDAELTRSGLALVMCSFSNETFNTAALIKPDWRNVFVYRPAQELIGGLVAAIGIGFIVLRRWLRVPSSKR